MLKAVIASLALAGLAAGAMPDPVSAADETRAKSRRTTETRQRTTTQTRRTTTTSESRQQYGTRDRTTYNTKDGRINGTEFFNQVMERTPTGDN